MTSGTSLDNVPAEPTIRTSANAYSGYIFPSIDPVALSLGPLSIKWYGLAYLVGLLLGWGYIRHLLSTPRIWAPKPVPMTLAQVDDLLLYMTVGVVLGGRLGYIFLYEPETYLANPAKMIAVWEGGMSFHGALMGCALSCWLFGRNHKISGLTATDLVTASVPMGLVFGRFANFINAELWGRQTDVSWAVTFCNERIKAAHGGICPAGDIPRHPSQLYEAALEGVVLFIVLRILTYRFNALAKPASCREPSSSAMLSPDRRLNSTASHISWRDR